MNLKWRAHGEGSRGQCGVVRHWVMHLSIHQRARVGSPYQPSFSILHLSSQDILNVAIFEVSCEQVGVDVWRQPVH